MNQYRVTVSNLIFDKYHENIKDVEEIAKEQLDYIGAKYDYMEVELVRRMPRREED